MPLRYALAALVLLFAPAAAAQDACPANATEVLSLSDVRARLYNNGPLFWRGGDAEYTVPEDGGVGTMFAANLWVGGTVGGEARIAAALLAQGVGDTYEFSPGRLGDDGEPAQDCAAADRIYRITAPEVAAFDAGNPAAVSLAEWPIGLGAPAVDAQGNPIVPTSPDQTLDLDAGERPVVYGTETLFWVMNDVRTHGSTGSMPLGVEVRASAFSVNDPDEATLNQATFYRYEIVNKSGVAIDDLRAGLWMDYDLGDATDDYIASDAGRSLSIVYNADDDDAIGAGGYGIPPAAGVDVLSGGFSNLYYQDSNSPTGNPIGAPVEGWLNLLRGRWVDGTPLSRGGLGYDPGNPDVTTWHWGGDPVTGSFWTEENADGQGTARQGNDRRAVVSAQPVDLAPGASHIVDFAFLFAQGTDRLDSVTELRAASDLVQARYDDGSLFESTSGDLGLPPLAAPPLASPADGTAFMPPEAVTLDWETVADTDSYRVEYGTDAAFRSAQSQTVTVPPLTVDFDTLPQGSFEPLYWRVTPTNASGIGPASEARSFTYGFEFEPGLEVLSNGQLAFLEVVGPGGADPCGGAAGSTFGCTEAGGNAVYVPNGATTPDDNGTGAYTLTSLSVGPEQTLTAFAPRDFEIRFTSAGSIAYHPFRDTDANETHRVPFEVWDIGVVPLGADGVPAPNDPSDDVQLVPVLFSDDATNGNGACAFDLAEVPAAESALGVPLSDRIYAYYPVTTYAAFDAVAAPLVDAAPEGCYDDTDSAIRSLIDLDGGRPIQRVVVADLTGSGSAADLEGTVIRFHTTDPQPVAGDAAPTASALALTVAPNPSRGAARVSFTLPTAGTVRVRVVDTLGRTVAMLADGDRATGSHVATLPRGLAAGIYVVTVEAGDTRATQTLTVVR